MANDSYVEIHAGAGGTESQDWAEMLLRMYARWAERKGFKVETVEYQAGDAAGIKSATLLLKGEKRLWLCQDGKRRAPARTDQPLRQQRSPPYQFQFRLGLSGN